jgi:hypothetical protein
VNNTLKKKEKVGPMKKLKYNQRTQSRTGKKWQYKGNEGEKTTKTRVQGDF